MLYCGFAECEITPWKGTEIPGYFRSRINEGAIEPLFAKAVVFESAGEKCALVVCDMIQTERGFVLDIRRKAQQLTGIEPENIFVWATHTHTGGPVDNQMNVRHDKKYVNYMTAQAAQAIKNACSAMRPAKVGSATGKVEGVAYIRRFMRADGTAVMNPTVDDKSILGPEGEPDETFTIARIEDAVTGEIMGFLSSFGVHLDTVSGNLSCADYPGQLAVKVREKYGENVKSVFFTGPCGNTNHFDMNDITTRDAATMRFRMAEKLFKEFVRLNDTIVCTQSGFEISTRRFLAPLRCVNDEQIKWAQDILAGVENNFYDSRFHTDFFAQSIIDISNRVDETVETEVGVFKLGNLVIISWPGEVFVEFGIDIRRAYPGKDIIIGEMGGGSVYCYICTPQAVEHGSYEPMAVGTLCCEPDFGDRMVHETLTLMGKMGI